MESSEKVNVLRTSSPEAGECFQIVPEVHIALQASVGAYEAIPIVSPMSVDLRHASPVHRENKVVDKGLWNRGPYPEKSYTQICCSYWDHWVFFGFRPTSALLDSNLDWGQALAWFWCSTAGESLWWLWQCGRGHCPAGTCHAGDCYFSFQPVLHNWSNKDCGMCYPVYRMMHIKEHFLLIGKRSHIMWWQRVSSLAIWVVLYHMSVAI